MRFGLRNLRATQPVDENDPLRVLLRGRDTSWYKGDLLKINLIIVSGEFAHPLTTVLPHHDLDEQWL